MVRALLQGKRAGTPLQALILLAVLLVGVPCIWLVLDARGNAARALRVQQRMTSAFSRYQNAVYQTCVVHNTKQELTNTLEQADTQLMRTIISIERNDPADAAPLQARRIAAYQVKLRADMSFLAAPLPDCNRLRQIRINTTSLVASR